MKTAVSLPDAVFHGEAEMITDRPEWAQLVASPAGVAPATKEAKRAWKTLREALAEGDVLPLVTLAATGSDQERLAALWVLAFGVGAGLLTDATRPAFVEGLTAALHATSLMSHQWYHARNCLYDLEPEIDPVDLDLQRRGISRERFRELEAERAHADLASSLPPVVSIPVAVEALVAAHPSPVPAALAPTLHEAADAWRNRRDQAGLHAVSLYVLNRPPCTVSYRQIVDLLGSPNEYDRSRVYYGDAAGGLVIVANEDGNIDAVKAN